MVYQGRKELLCPFMCYRVLFDRDHELKKGIPGVQKNFHAQKAVLGREKAGI